LDTALKYLLLDRDAVYATPFHRRVESTGIEQVRTAPRSPWQNPYVERLELFDEGRGDCLVVRLEAEDSVLDILQRAEVVGRKRLALDDREVDFLWQ